MVDTRLYNQAQGEALERDGEGSRYLVQGIGGQLVNEVFDYVDIDYTDGNPTLVTYKNGGASGTTVATLTITYTVDGCINTVTKA
jgi:hypothetical protein